MTLNYSKVWEAMNELEMVTSRVCSAREILDSAIDALESGNKEKAESLMYATDEFLQYYLKDFDEKFKIAWSETVVKVKQEDPCMPPWGHSDLEYCLANSFLTEDRISNFPGEQYTEEELNAMCDAAEKQKDNLTYNEAIAAGWEMTADGFWIKTEKKDTPNKWILPVQQIENGDTMETEYFIQLPDDLLEKTGWEENDTLVWVDNKDGTFTLRKVTGPIGMDEC